MPDNKPWRSVVSWAISILIIDYLWQNLQAVPNWEQFYERSFFSIAAIVGFVLLHDFKK